MGVEVILKNVRITFPKIFPGQEEAYEGKGDPYWSASFLMERNHPQTEELRAAIRKAAQEKWPAQWEGNLKLAVARDKLPVHDGDMKADKVYGAAYAGMSYVSARNNANSTVAPTVFAAEIDPQTGDRRQVKSANDPYAPYSGSYVDVKLNLFGYDQGGIGVGAQIAGLAFREHGDRLSGGATASAKDFEKIPETATDGAKSFF